ncbi:hypothetical protein M9H77_01728 [Catharanthus roseus]|uniref:Uncharacterized protein n=1 Tax=Catharanthus roseus TaxID=4058 RepID=A0ACC0C6T1_CATRO|nr:hypothetical protein M9H77_01728 [Catharanthus roseus]
MQSKLAAATATKLNRIFLRNQFQPCRFATIPTGKAADPAIHAVNPEEKDDASEAAKAATNSDHKAGKQEDPYVPPKSPYPSASSPKVQSTGVNQQTEPINQQKRRASSVTISDVSCVGLDGSPWPEDRRDRREERKEQEEDDKEYFEHHKASPLSEMEMAETRKPITMATDGTGGGYFGDYGGGVMLWRPEQLDTAEDSLRRAMEIWRQNAMRGDPNSPHGRVLRTLRGEFW